MQLQLAQQQAAAGAQELYANGYADAAAAAAASSSAKQMAPPRQSSTDYRFLFFAKFVMVRPRVQFTKCPRNYTNFPKFFLSHQLGYA